MVDILKYMKGDGRVYRVNNNRGGSELMCTRAGRNGGEWFHQKNSEIEQLGNDTSYIFRGIDTSDFSGKVYMQFFDGKLGAPWIKRNMRVGEVFRRSPQVRWFKASHDWTQPNPFVEIQDPILNDWMVISSDIKLMAVHPQHDFKGLIIPNVIELVWFVNGLWSEHYFYAENYGLVGFHSESADFDSWITELNPAEQISNVKRIINWDNPPFPPTIPGLPLPSEGLVIEAEAESAATPSEAVYIEALAELAVREGPSRNDAIKVRTAIGDKLIALDDVMSVATRVGMSGQWMRVRTLQNVEGYVAGWYVRPYLVALQPRTGTVVVRSAPHLDYAEIATLSTNDRAISRDPLYTLAQSLGVQGEWLYVELADGKRGWCLGDNMRVAAEAVDLLNHTPPVPEPLDSGVSGHRVFMTAADKIAIRDSGSTTATLKRRTKDSEPIIPLEELQQTAQKFGRSDEWLHITTPDGTQGWVAGWYMIAGAIIVSTTDQNGTPVLAGADASELQIAIVQPQDALLVLEDLLPVGKKLGQANQWLYVRLPDGTQGWVEGRMMTVVDTRALVHGIDIRQPEDESPPTLEPPPPVDSPIAGVVTPIQVTTIYAGPRDRFASVSEVGVGVRLAMHITETDVTRKLADGGQNYIRVTTPKRMEGWVRASHVRLVGQGEAIPDTATERRPTNFPRTTRITLAVEGGVPDRTNTEAGRQRALSFDHDPIFTRLPVLDTSTIRSYSGFGPNNFSYNNFVNQPHELRAYRLLCLLHNGIDFGIPVGTTLCAVDWGVVVYVGSGENGYRALPWNVIVRHGRYVALYGHMKEAPSEFPVVKGQIVAPGDPLGPSWTAFDFPHLHFEMRRISPGYINRLQTGAQKDFPEDLGAQTGQMSQRFHHQGWSDWSPDHYVNPALFFDPPIETHWQQGGWAHADPRFPQTDTNRNGFVDRIALVDASIANDYDPYAISSIPVALNYFFYAGCKQV